MTLGSLRRPDPQRRSVVGVPGVSVPGVFVLALTPVAAEMPAVVPGAPAPGWSMGLGPNAK